MQLCGMGLNNQYFISCRFFLHLDIPRLKFGIINLHPAKQEYVPYDYDVLLTERMTSYIMTEQNLMNLLQS